MRRSLPSITALVVAGARGLGSLRGAEAGEPLDPVARALLPWPLGATLSGLERAAARWPGLVSVSAMASLGLVDHVVLRTLAIDQAVQHASVRGVRQLVILGAGLDARAHRMGCLGETTVFEVDYPSTQAYKQARAAHLPVEAARIERVPIDFEHERLRDGLARSSHDPSVPTCFIWEGVTMYLPRIATASTLADIGAASSSGSSLIVSYLTPEKVTAGSFIGPVADLIFRVLGEPLRGVMSTAELRELLASTGMLLASDSGPLDWARSFGYRRRSLFTLSERIAIATYP